MWNCTFVNIATLRHTHTHTYIYIYIYEGVSKSFRTESITKYTLTTINTRWEATQIVIAAKFTRLTHKIVIHTTLSGRELYRMQLSLQVASPETFGYTLVFRLSEPAPPSRISVDAILHAEITQSTLGPNCPPPPLSQLSLPVHVLSAVYRSLCVCELFFFPWLRSPA
jgi:hypothetical protein